MISCIVSNNSLIINLDKNLESEWRVEGSLRIQVSSSVLSVTDKNGDIFPLLDSSTKVLQNGWRSQDKALFLTITPGDTITIEFDNHPSCSTSPLQTFNDLHHGVTIVGHHVTNLHEWASDFYASPLLFTWLIERPSALEMDGRLPIIALSVLVATPMSIKWLVNRDQKR